MFKHFESCWYEPIRYWFLLNYSFDINQLNSSTCFQRLRTFISKILHSGRAYPQSKATVISWLENKIFQRDINENVSALRYILIRVLKQKWLDWSIGEKTNKG
jgi:hypothetical protein